MIAFQPHLHPGRDSDVYGTIPFHIHKAQDLFKNDRILGRTEFSLPVLKCRWRDPAGSTIGLDAFSGLHLAVDAALPDRRPAFHATKGRASLKAKQDVLGRMNTIKMV